MISLVQWILCAALSSVFWLWVLCWGGAQRLEGTFASAFLISWFAPRWSAEGIRLFALLSLVGTVLVFVLGLVDPGLRCWSAC